MDYSKLSFKDFENIPDQNMMERASSFNTYLNYLDDKVYISVNVTPLFRGKVAAN